MLEQQQEKLCAALRELWVRHERNEHWVGDRLVRNKDGKILTHDILDRLGLLKSGPEDSIKFEEDPETLREMMQREEIVQLPTPSTLHGDYSPEPCEIALIDPPSCSLGNEMDMPLEQYQDFAVTPAPSEHFLDPGAYIEASMSSSPGQDFYPSFYSQDPGGFANVINDYPSNGNIYNGLGIIPMAQRKIDRNPCLPPFIGRANYPSNEASM